MFDTKQEILDQLRAGEDSRAEFKEVRLGDRSVLSPNTEEMAGELVAFANADGGVVFLGVDDSGSVQGLPEDRLPAIELYSPGSLPNTLTIETMPREPSWRVREPS